MEGGSGLWGSPTAGVETCGALKEDWQGEREDVEDSHGREGQEEGEAEPHSNELFDAGSGPGQGEDTEPWRLSGEGEMIDDLEPPSLFPGDPTLQEEEVGSEPGHPGHDQPEDPDRDGEEEEEEEEGGDEDQEGRSEEGRDSRAGGDLGPRRPAGGKRGRGRGEQATSAASSSSSKAPLSGGGRHKQARRRNHHHHHQGRSRGPAGSRAAAACRELLLQSLRPWCLSCLRMVVELIVLVAHRCGEAVEAGGAAVYDSGSRLLRKAHDLPVLRAEAGRLLGGAQRLVGRLTGRGWGAAASCLVRLRSAALLGHARTAALLSRLAGERGRRWWAVFRDSRAWKGAAVLWEKAAGAFQRRGQRASPCGVGRGSPGQELERLLELAQIPEDQLDPFAVLGVEASASDTELKRAYRQLAVQVCPSGGKAVSRARCTGGFICGEV